MKNTIQLLSNYQQNGVISLKDLRHANLYLYKLLLNNFDTLSTSLRNEGIEILDDKYSLKGIAKIQLYLRYYFDNLVDLTTLRNEHVVVYRHICKLGNPVEIITSMGFKVEYGSSLSEIKIKEKLQRMIDGNGKLRPLDKAFHNRLYYRAKKRGMTVPQYLQYLGFNRSKKHTKEE